MIQSGGNEQGSKIIVPTAIDASNDAGVAIAWRPQRFDVRTRGTRDVMVVTASGELDAVTVARFREAINNALAVPSAALIVDLSNLDFLSSAGLSALQDGHESAGRAKHFCVVADGPATSRPMQMIGLDRKLRLYPTVDDALSDIR